MKKIKLILFGMIMLCWIPFQVKAVTIDKTIISGPNEKRIGDEIAITFEMSLTGTEADNNLKLVGVVFYFDYDENVYAFQSVNTIGFDTEAYIDENGNYFVASELQNNWQTDYCVVGSGCKNYKATMNFIIKNTEVTSSAVTIRQLVALFIDKDRNLEEIDVDDLITSTIDVGKSYTVTIKKNVETVSEPPKMTIIEKNPEVKIPTTPPVMIKSSNADLKSLIIENYNIEFNKNTIEYEVEIDKDINQLTVNAEVEDSKASYNIMGADDLKANNYKVSIEVTAEDGIKKTYLINAKVKKEVKEEIKAEFIEDKEHKEKAFVNKDFVMKIGILFGGIIFIVIIIFITNYIRNKKIDKMLDDL